MRGRILIFRGCVCPGSQLLLRLCSPWVTTSDHCTFHFPFIFKSETMLFDILFFLFFFILLAFVWFGFIFSYLILLASTAMCL